MARKCSLTGKGPMSGHKVSHSQRKTNRSFGVNVMRKKVFNPATGTMVSVKLSASALRTLKKWQAQGKHYDVRTLMEKA